MDWLSQARSFLDHGKGGADYFTGSSLTSLIQNIGGILTTIGVAIVLAGLLIVGIKYMGATPEEAAKLKTKLVGLVVAGIVIIGAWGIWSLAYQFFNEVTTI